ncbi:MAG: hypothetical protein GX491_04760 [Chloroflexi bacterium]|nr:hypothetical protein [Chloroflexota bacterium]
MMDEREEALFFFRKIVYTLYLEIGGLQEKVHPGIAAKADLTNAFFQGEKERQAAMLYLQTEHETDPEKIIAPYKERTGLTLEDIHTAFVEGDWRNKFGGYNIGGPKWVRISELAAELRRCIEQEDWESAAAVIYDIKKAKTNQGYLIHQFDRLERRR